MFRTELIFWRAEGDVVDRGDYHLVRTPSNPTYYGGNLLYFNHPPGSGDYARWMKLFNHEFKDDPDVKHLLFMWDTDGNETGSIDSFLDGGFEIQSNVALATREVSRPPKFNNEIEVRRLQSDEEWESVLEAKVKSRDARFSLETYTPFKKKWLDLRRRLSEGGLGSWYGAFLNGELVGDLGLFRDGNLGRFQDVGTDLNYRRQGICGTLVYEVSKEALKSEGIQTLVMAADENYHAASIYESVGFKPAERYAVACRYPAKT